jgi:hypothetical protein
MKWPLQEPPDDLLQKNEYQARVIANHVIATNKGEAPFVLSGSGKLEPNVSNVPGDASIFSASLSDEFAILGQFLIRQQTGRNY